MIHSIEIAHVWYHQQLTKQGHHQGGCVLFLTSMATSRNRWSVTGLWECVRTNRQLEKFAQPRPRQRGSLCAIDELYLKALLGLINIGERSCVVVQYIYIHTFIYKAIVNMLITYLDCKEIQYFLNIIQIYFEYYFPTQKL